MRLGCGSGPQDLPVFARDRNGRLEGGEAARANPDPMLRVIQLVGMQMHVTNRTNDARTLLVAAVEARMGAAPRQNVRRQDNGSCHQIHPLSVGP